MSKLSPIHGNTAKQIDDILELCNITPLELFLWISERRDFSSNPIHVANMAMELLCNKADVHCLGDHFYCGYAGDNFVIKCTIEADAVNKLLMKVKLSKRSNAWNYLMDNYGVVS